MKWNLLPVSVAVVFFLSCAAPAPTPEASVDLEAERSALGAAADAYHAAGASGDFDTTRTLYTSDARIFPPNAPEENGTAGVENFLETFTSVPGLQIRFEDPIVEVGPEGGMGFTITPAVIRYEGPDGEMVGESVRDLHVWRRDADGNWKVVVDMWNSGSPLPATAAAP